MRPHVLVIDDSLIVRMDLRGALVEAGFDVTIGETKRTATRLLDERTFDAVVLDVMLPDGDGVEILRRIRADEKHAATPVIMLSAEADVRDRVRGLTMGADEYVGKPYNIAYFIRRLRDLCRSGRASNVPPPNVVGCRRILAVDDSPTFLDSIANILRQDGHDVVLARSGREALEMLAAQTIDCVVLDLHMPDLDGLETLRRIRRTPGRESTPTLMLTGSVDPADQICAQEAGVDEFLHKTVTFDVVRAKIRHLLRSKRTVDAHNTPRSGLSKMNSWRVSQSEPASTGAVNPRTARAVSHDFSPLFVETASTMGLNSMLARDTLAKTLDRLSIDPRSMNRDDLMRALPAIRQTLGMFFSAEEIKTRVDALTALATRSG
jgi:DNA-binding response OmpR family regulator